MRQLDAKPSLPVSKPVLGLGLLLLTAAAYWRVMGNDFVGFDDWIYVTSNRFTQAGLTTESLRWAFTTIHHGNWHPLTWISHMVDCQLFGLDPKWHHLTNLLFHLADTLLLFIVLIRMTGSKWQSWFVALLFGIHPLHVESVAWIAERKDVLSTFFWMLTLLAYVRYVRSPRPGLYAPIALFLALGLMVKPMLVTLPFVLLLLDYWPLRRFAPETEVTSIHLSRVRGLVLEKLPLFGLVVISSIVAFFAQRAEGAVSSLEIVPLPDRISNALVSCVGYITKMIWPSNLAVLYPHPGRDVATWPAIGAFVLLAAITLLVLRAGGRKPYLPVGWFWYLGTLLPVIGLVQVGSQAMADRYTYVPLIGLFIIVAWGSADLARGWRHGAAVLGTMAVIVTAALLALTWQQVGYWRDNLSLWTQDVRVNPNDPTGRNNLGAELIKRGRVDEAIPHLSRAISVNPRYSTAHFNLGMALNQQGQLQDAVLHFQQAVELDPAYAQAYLNLGVALARQGKFAEAAEQFQKALKVAPDYPEAHVNIGIELARQGKSDEAVRHFSEAARIRPDFVQAHYQLSLAYLALHDVEAARQEYLTVQRLDPTLARSLAPMFGP